MRHEGFVLVEAVLGMAVTIVMVGTLGSLGLGMYREHRDAREWAAARMVAAEIWERRAVAGMAGEERMEREGTVYRVSWGPGGSWHGIPIVRLSVEWNGVRGSRAVVWNGPMIGR
ncbi:MAG: hypothetical protein QJR01_02405 [Kyrpidia sp.]|nr:hypothetical protein [Kyrpidia sp.]